MKKATIKVSPEFKSQTTKAIASIVLFALIYLCILASAVGLTLLCIYGGIMLIALRPMFLTIALGIGLASLGFFILIFLLKFVFKSHKVDRSHLHEIKRKDEPGLFRLIDEIVNEVDTSFPKKVYLAMDVNAAVFYDSSFWSMFLPVRKNLQIGLGLVNTITQEELKAILAHEFGHFSQKTMKVGSYVYNVNQVIFNMLYDNESYEKLVQKWANISGYFVIFVGLAVKITEGIQWILRKLYGIVNKSYMSLSREMEFHADAIAASITGSGPLIRSLLRMNLADSSFNNTLAFYEARISENLTSRNIYQEHRFVMNFLAEYNGIKIVGDFPEVSIDELNRFNKSKLVVKDQWASHPSIEERIRQLEKSDAKSERIDHAPAEEVFMNIKETQEKLTRRLFKVVEYKGNPVALSPEEFQKKYKLEFEKEIFPSVYNGYYDNKNPVYAEIEAFSFSEKDVTVADLFSRRNVELVYTSIALRNDLETLRQIADRSIPAKTFDYDGRKYQREESEKLKIKLETELAQIDEEIKRNDGEIFSFFERLEKTCFNQNTIPQMYKDFFDHDRIFDTRYEVYTRLSNELGFVNVTTPLERIKTNFANIKPLENALKAGIKELLSDHLYQDEITEEMMSNFELYLSKNLEYFSGVEYYDKSLNVLYTAMNNYAYLLSRGYFLMKKRLLTYQEALMARIEKNQVISSNDGVEV